MGSPRTVADILAVYGHPAGAPPTPQRRSAPLLAALKKAGTQHIYADSANADEIRKRLDHEGGGIPDEIDGNTANQPLIAKVIESTLREADPRLWIQDLRKAGVAEEVDSKLLLYAIVAGRIANDIAQSLGDGHPWETSIQLHMDSIATPGGARELAHRIRDVAGDVLIKVPFTPDHPHCFLVARDLEKEGIPVNFTSTFSARQAVAAALLADVTRTNIFMGRLDDGLRAELLGEHVDLAAQRAIRRARDDAGAKTQLIIASLRDWRSLHRVSGCDVFTAPCEVLVDFLKQDEVGPDDIASRLETSYEDRLGVSEEVLERLGMPRLARLWEVEPEFFDFLVELRGSADYHALEDGAALRARFADAGFADFFHAPSDDERRQLARGKVPEIGGELTKRLALDTHYSLRANADFGKHQRTIDAEFERFF